VPVYIPIVSEFKSDGIEKAAREFKSLEGAGAKASFAIKKAALPAAAALAGLGVAAVDAAKAAAEDAAAAEKLAVTLQNTTGATAEQVAAVEDYISKTSVAAAVSDDELRPALQTLVTGTKDVAAAQELMGLALDISAATGKDLETVSAALAKGYNGQNTALKKLDPSLGKLIKDGASTEEVFAQLTDTFGGQAAAAAGTAEGKFKSLQIALGEAKESIGAALLPVITTLASKLTAVAGFVQENSTLVLTLAAVIGTLAGAVIAINAAMTVYKAVQAATVAINTLTGASFSALWVATGVGVIVAIIAALVVLQAKFNIFGKLADLLKRAFSAAWDGIKTGLEFVWGLVKRYVDLYVKVFEKIVGVFTTIKDAIVGAFRFAFNKVAELWNSTIGKLSFRVPDWVPGLGGKGFDVPDIPMLAAGGIVTSPTLAMIGEAGPEAVIPLDRFAGTGGSTVINISGALDPVAVGSQVRRLLLDTARREGRALVL
jgi:hypothetical protein